MAILDVKNLTKMYGVKNIILKNVNLQMEQGEFISVMGPSGSGKSTLLYNISGMDKMTEGSVLLDGQDLGSLSEKELAHLRLLKIGFIFQQMHLLKHLSIIDNIILSAYLANKHRREKINEKATQLMRKTGIIQLADRHVTQASGGQLQRVAICRALMNDPKIIFGDEPTGALNSTSAAEVMNLLVEINEQGTAILLVTHDVKVAAKTERVLYMVDGTIVGEKKIGKYDKSKKNESQLREEKLSQWLLKRGF
ncbi:ABC transporter ATP-binding protein [Evansella halocellulosilytica]|uniref:ABC transporter ATP-binding protein n=1 Tax=Evansella halocellulosilytica TaxID=2011013 RepID=UPI000BB983FE|nr:ABC transporter ATP-binding protein [Evansella halocellulosilytica]